MCLSLYVGSAVELPVRPWAEHPFEFNVEPLRERPGHVEVRRRLQKPFVYEIGAHTGCACGFDRPAGEDQRAKWKLSIDSLARWLVAAVEPGPVNILICWQGDEGKKPRRRTVRAEAIAKVDFRSAQDQPLRVRVH